MDAADVARERDRALSGGRPVVREPIRESFGRATRLGLRPDSYLPPVALSGSALEDLRERHPLGRQWSMLKASLRWTTTDPGHLLFLSDAEGNLLQVEGDRPTLRRAELAHLVPGARWSEQAAGTSGVGTALALRRPFQVFGAEHYLSVATDYMCTAVPIRNPVNGEVLGAVDLTCGLRMPRALPLSLLTTAARLVESQLQVTSLRDAARLRQRYTNRIMRRYGARSALVAADGRVLEADPPGWLPRALTPPLEGLMTLSDGQSVVAERVVAGGPYLVLPVSAEESPALQLTALGRDQVLVRVDGMTRELSRRHSEIVVCLAATPGGMSAPELARAVYGPAGKALTIRGELSRLRPALAGRLAAEPYRLTGEVDADFHRLDDDITSTPAGALLDRYPGPLLPRSTAPAVVAVRDRLHERLGLRVAASADPDTLTRWRAFSWSDTRRQIGQFAAR